MRNGAILLIVQNEIRSPNGNANNKVNANNMNDNVNPFASSEVTFTNTSIPYILFL